jgi:hypothetical protein
VQVQWDALVAPDWGRQLRVLQTPDASSALLNLTLRLIPWYRRMCSRAALYLRRRCSLLQMFHCPYVLGYWNWHNATPLVPIHQVSVLFQGEQSSDSIWFWVLESQYCLAGRESIRIGWKVQGLSTQIANCYHVSNNVMTIPKTSCFPQNLMTCLQLQFRNILPCWLRVI